MSVIDISGILNCPAVKKAQRFRGGSFLNAFYDDIEDEVIEGEVIRINVAEHLNGKIYVFKEGCFDSTIESGCTVHMQADHNDGMRFGSTDNGLELFADGHSLRYRANLSKMPGGHILARLVKSKSRPAVSMGVDIHNFEDKEIAGHNVRIVYGAHLNEISAIKIGAAANASAFVVKKDAMRPLSASITPEHELNQSVHRLQRGVALLKDRFDPSNADPSPPRRPYTLADSYRWDQEDHERLASANRARHYF